MAPVFLMILLSATVHVFGTKWGHIRYNKYGIPHGFAQNKITPNLGGFVSANNGMTHLQRGYGIVGYKNGKAGMSIDDAKLIGLTRFHRLDNNQAAYGFIHFRKDLASLPKSTYDRNYFTRKKHFKFHGPRMKASKYRGMHPGAMPFTRHAKMRRAKYSAMPLKHFPNIRPTPMRFSKGPVSKLRWGYNNLRKHYDGSQKFHPIQSAGDFLGSRNGVNIYNINGHIGSPFEEHYKHIATGFSPFNRLLTNGHHGVGHARTPKRVYGLIYRSSQVINGGVILDSELHPFLQNRGMITPSSLSFLESNRNRQSLIDDLTKHASKELKLRSGTGIVLKPAPKMLSRSIGRHTLQKHPKIHKTSVDNIPEIWEKPGFEKLPVTDGDFIGNLATNQAAHVEKAFVSPIDNTGELNIEFIGNPVIEQGTVNSGPMTDGTGNLNFVSDINGMPGNGGNADFGSKGVFDGNGNVESGFGDIGNNMNDNTVSTGDSNFDFSGDGNSMNGNFVGLSNNDRGSNFGQTDGGNIDQGFIDGTNNDAFNGNIEPTFSGRPINDINSDASFGNVPSNGNFNTDQFQFADNTGNSDRRLGQFSDNTGNTEPGFGSFVDNVESRFGGVTDTGFNSDSFQGNGNNRDGNVDFGPVSSGDNFGGNNDFGSGFSGDNPRGNNGFGSGFSGNNPRGNNGFGSGFSGDNFGTNNDFNSGNNVDGNAGFSRVTSSNTGFSVNSGTGDGALGEVELFNVVQ